MPSASSWNSSPSPSAMAIPGEPTAAPAAISHLVFGDRGVAARRSSAAARRHLDRDAPPRHANGRAPPARHALQQQRPHGACGADAARRHARAPRRGTVTGPRACTERPPRASLWSHTLTWKRAISPITGFAVQARPEARRPFSRTMPYAKSSAAVAGCLVRSAASWMPC